MRPREAKKQHRSARRLVVIVLGLTFAAAALLWRAGALPKTVRAQSDVALEPFADVPAEQIDAAALQPVNPPDFDRLQGVRNRPRRQPPPLLSEHDVEVGLNGRLQRMHERQAAREAREAQGQSAGVRADVATIPDREDPPRAPEPPPPPESLEE